MSARLMWNTVYILYRFIKWHRGHDAAAAAAAEPWMKGVYTRHMAARKLTSIAWRRNGPVHV